MEEDGNRAWCSLHSKHPKECWELHVLVPSTLPLSEEDAEKRIAREHIRLQREQRVCHICKQWYKGYIGDHMRTAHGKKESDDRNSQPGTVRGGGDQGSGEVGQSGKLDWRDRVGPDGGGELA